jgi:hypothetical protein
MSIRVACLRGTELSAMLRVCLDLASARMHLNRTCRSRSYRTVKVLTGIALIASCAAPPPEASGEPQLGNVGQTCEAYGISGPTVVAFMDPTGRTNEPYVADLLADFQRSVRRARDQIDSQRISLHECYRRSFVVVVGDRRHEFKGDKSVGYYFISPSREPRVEYDVMTDADLIDVMKEYFGPDVMASALHQR